MRMKYIMVEFDHEHAGRQITPILFPEAIVHKDMLESMQRRPYRADLISAGFVDIYVEDGRQIVSCYGESESIGCKSRGADDAFIIRHMQKGWTYSSPTWLEKQAEHERQYGS